MLTAGCPEVPPNIEPPEAAWPNGFAGLFAAVVTDPPKIEPPPTAAATGAWPKGFGGWETGGLVVAGFRFPFTPNVLTRYANAVWSMVIIFMDSSCA